MRLCNCTMNEIAEKIGKKSIVIFGVGEFWELYGREKFPEKLIHNIAFAIDNNVNESRTEISGKKIPVYLPDRLCEEQDCAIILMSSNYMYEMYLQLEKMHLNDTIDCYSFPLMLANSVGSEKAILKSSIFNNAGERKIEKIIHSFWFSGDKKPEEYQKGVDSWKKACPEYEIIEWNMDNYDYTKNEFMRQAIEKKKWAFASDYARLDVVYRLGGIYMDMDVELLKSFDELLYNDAFFTFDTQNDIDLGTFGAQKENCLVRELMDLYENIEFSSDMKSMNFYCQPRYIRSVLKRQGLMMDGSMQCINKMAFLSRNYLVPKDSIIYELNGKNEDTIGIHHYNAGWKNDDYRTQRIEKNRKLKRIFES